MLKKIVTASLAILLVNLAVASSAFASDKLTKEAKLAAKVKAGIAKLGTGPDARVKVKLKDGTKLKGYVSEISEDSFTVTDPETGTNTTVPYPSAKQVRGNHLSTHVVIAIGFVIFVIIMLALVDADKT